MQPQKEQRVERRLAAIFAADVAGYSRLMSQDEAGTLRALAAAREVMDGLIAEHGGRIANTAGDSVLAEFPSAVDAVQCAVATGSTTRRGEASQPGCETSRTGEWTRTSARAALLHAQGRRAESRRRPLLLPPQRSGSVS